MTTDAVVLAAESCLGVDAPFGGMRHQGGDRHGDDMGAEDIEPQAEARWLAVVKP
jgi:hypothetical protein